LEMIPQRTDENDTFSKALVLFDPEGTLTPGSRGYDTISAMIRGWIDQCGPDYALDMAQTGAKHLHRWRKFL
jgi:hypothetical protein